MLGGLRALPHPAAVHHQDGAEFKDVLLGRQRAARLGGFKEEHIVQWAVQLASGLKALDESGLVHQDLHNGNIMLAGLPRDPQSGKQVVQSGRG